jgi:hypothetical protein
MNRNTNLLALHFDFIREKIANMIPNTRTMRTRAISTGTHHTKPPIMERMQHVTTPHTLSSTTKADKIPQSTQPPVMQEAEIM